MIERYQLRYFLAVIDAGNFSRAAVQVNVTQPTLSIAIAKLEESVGVKLFERNSQRVHLTDAGVRLQAHARTIEHEFNLLNARGAEIPRMTAFRLGVLSTLPTELITDLTARHRASGSQLDLELVEGTERDVSARLQRRRIDAAITLLRPGEQRFPSEVLFEEGYSLATAATHAVAHLEVVSGEALAHETMMVRRHCEVLADTSRYFTDRGVRPRFSYRSVNDDRIVALVAAGFGITVVPDSLRSPGLAHVKLAGFEPRRTIGLMFADSSVRAAIEMDLLATLRSARPADRSQGPPRE
jgi:DNA-binding transcriptional LysR family regulator